MRNSKTTTNTHIHSILNVENTIEMFISEDQTHTQITHPITHPLLHRD